MLLDVAHSKVTVATLKRSGWSADRKVDTTEFRRQLESKGHLVLDAAHEFLESFGGLSLLHNPRASGRSAELNAIHKRSQQHLPLLKRRFFIPPFIPYDIATFDLSILDTLEVVDREWYERTVGTQLCPVGHVDKFMDLLISPEYELYGAIDRYVYLKGRNASESIVNLCELTHLRAWEGEYEP